MVLVATILGFIVMFCSILLFLTWREIAGMTAGLKQISREKTNQKLMLSFSNSLLEKLAEQINELLEQKKISEIGYKNKDLQQRQAIANISHDLRTPLTSIIGYMQLLQNGNLPEDEKQQYSEVVLNRAKALQLLIMDFYDLSRCEAGEFSLDLKAVRLQDVLSEQLAAYYHDFTAKGISPEIHIDATAPSIIADENAVRRIYQNLIQNILKHGEGKAEVTLSCDKEMVVSCFSNPAPGLTREEASRIFERFYTADRVRSGQNTGLGLTIVRVMAESMGGIVRAELTDGKLCITIIWNKIF